MLPTMTPQMAPLADCPRETLAAVEGLLTDIDETVSTHGRLTAEAYGALEALKKAGVRLIPVTGRPAGWCDHIARFWPVDAVVGENGAFSMYLAGAQGAQKLRRFETLGDADSAAAKSKLAALRGAITREFPQAQFASDQAYR